MTKIAVKMRIGLVFISVVSLVQCMGIPHAFSPAPLMVKDRDDVAALNEDDFALGAELTYGRRAPQGIPIESANGENDERSANGLFEGDILLTPQQREIVDRGIQSEIDQMRSSVVDEWRRWPKTGDSVIIPYTLDSAFNERERGLIAAGIDQFHQSTCIKLVGRTDQRDYVDIFKGNPGQCYANLGRVGGKQPLSLGEGCPGTGVVTHEIMHTLGWWHEQSRPDRDQYIKVHWDNIDESMHSQFRVCEGCSDQGSPYDTTSVMQYATWAFQKSRDKPSMTKIGCPDDEVWPSKECRLGQYDGMNESDLFEINKLYCGGGDGNASTEKPNVTTEKTCKNNPDVEKHCDNWEKEGYCEHSYVKYMKKNCALACGCPEVTTKPPCKNNPDVEKHCDYWEEEGYCEKTYVKYMKKNCALACGCPE